MAKVPERRFNYHHQDNGVWCPWSVCTVAEGSAAVRCPKQCKDSKIVTVEVKVQD